MTEQDLALWEKLLDNAGLCGGVPITRDELRALIAEVRRLQGGIELISREPVNSYTTFHEAHQTVLRIVQSIKDLRDE